ncbi:maleylpyruvate isomerase family mycothiol-dependent enzyme [Skermania sp. ID1734]|uniref:maleylpyruvate isomerase family mycothiol-dependent enzyme n=1 Tax=Skermania sp. ID1734 TaxID=2597516 RepID=UPI00117EFBD5|nr:maleylpyruvate isomerase family mycothiol-dependent enzyme [Skermania sp. ID1734]TSD99351.1 maleylpyruvate isomerase family mycothiol-dependent enzyme [Skermania sp. ID1734]
MAEAQTREYIAAERRELAEVFSALSPQQWEAPTLCAGWRPREVLAHITMQYRMSMPRFALEMVRDRGNFNRMADRTARRDAGQYTSEELVALLDANAEHPWRPPGGGFAGALSHDVIHGLDVTEALGLGRKVPPERLAVVLGGLGQRQLKFFGVDLTGVRLEATDMDWSYGEGEPFRAPAQQLLLKVSGRRIP